MQNGEIIVDSKNIDYGNLVGREIRLRTEQFPYKLLSTKVLAVTDNNLVIDRSGDSGRINQLIGHQCIEVLFDYRGEPILFSSKLLIPATGRFYIPIAPQVRPQVRRQFVRFGLSKNVRLTFFDDVNIGFIRLSKLKWLETNTIDIGGGGMLVKVPVFVSEDDYVVLNLGIEGFSMPKLLVGRIRHKQHDEENRTNIGIEFIVREGNALLLPKSLIQNLPPQLFDFDEHKRKELAHFLGEKYRHFLEDKE